MSAPVARLAFLEFTEEVDALEAALAAEGATLHECRIVALEPKARLALMRRGIACDSTLPYLPNTAHERIIRASEGLMVYLRSSFDFTDDRGVTVSYETEIAHNARMLCNHLMKLVEIITAAIAENPGARVYAAVGSGCTGGALIGDSERYAGRVAQRLAEAPATGCEFVPLPGAAASGPRAADRVPAPTWLGRAWAGALTRALRSRDTVLVPRASGYFAGFLPRLASELPGAAFVGIDFDGSPAKAVVGSLTARQRTGFPLRTLALSFLRSRGTEAERARLGATMDFLFGADFELTHAGVDLSDLLAAKAEAAWRPLLLRLLDDSAALGELYNGLPRSFVMSFIALGRMGVAGELAKRVGRKSLFVSHGSHPVPADDVHEIELLNLARGFMLSEYTDTALANPVQEAHLSYFKARLDWLEGEALKTGPLVFAKTDASARPAAKAALGIAPSEFVITHAVTVKSRAAERFHFLETLDEFVESVSRLIRTVDSIEGAHLVVRVHPGFVLSDDELRELLPPSRCYTISSSGAFRSVLAATDLLVSYSSTSIDEALSNHIPVLLFDAWARYNHFGTPVFDGSGEGCWPVCYVDSQDRLGQALLWMRSRLEHDGEPGPSDLASYDYGDNYFETLVGYARTAFSAEQEAR